jgi:DNA-binding MarR family transcriptional regulator
MGRKRDRALGRLAVEVLCLFDPLTTLLDLPPGVSVSGAVVLMLLDRFGTQTMPQLARRRSMSRQRIRSLVQELVQAGLVEREENPEHRRSNLVRLSVAGDAWVERLLGGQTFPRLALSRTQLQQAAKTLQSLALCLPSPSSS